MKTLWGLWKWWKCTHWTFLAILCIAINNIWHFTLEYNHMKNITNSINKSVAICLVIKLNELCEFDDLVEWIFYHQLLGISRMYIYDNNSTIDLKSIFVNDAVIHHRVEGNRIQSHCYDMCLKSYGALHSWLVLIDLDEFIVLDSKKNLTDYLNDFTAYGALVLFEKFYGSSNHTTRPAGGVLSNYNECKSTDYFKSIINTRYIHANDIHSPSQFINGYYFVSSEKRRACDESRIRMKCLMTFQDIWINHYSVKSTEEFESKKMKGGGNGKYRNDNFYNWANENTYNCGTIHVSPRNIISHHFTNASVTNNLISDIPPRFCRHHDDRESSSIEFIWSFVSKKKSVFEIGSNILNRLDYYICANYKQGKLKSYYFAKDRYYGRQVRMYDSHLCLNHINFIGVTDPSPPHDIASKINSYTDLNAIDIIIVGSDYRIHPILLLLREGYTNYVILVGWYSDYYHILLEYMTIIDCLDEVIILQKKDLVNKQSLLSVIPKYNHNTTDFKWMTRINY